LNAIAALTGPAGPEALVPMLAAMRHRSRQDPRVVAGEGMAIGGAPVDTAAGRMAIDAETAETVALLAAAPSGDAEAIDRLEGGFAFIRMDGDRLFAGRDPLGIKPLYYAGDEGSMLFASELKALAGRAAPVQTFPPGCLYDSAEGFRRFHPHRLPEKRERDDETAASMLRESLVDGVRRRLPTDGEAGVLLSGGLDSSVIAVLASRIAGNLHSFSAGTAESEDLGHARALAGMLGLCHHEYVFSAEEARRVLPQVIFHLESFDYLLVRSAIVNFLASRAAGEHVRTVLCGEGADELFAGYDDLKGLNEEDLDDRLEKLSFGCHDTGLQRVDRMNAAHGVSGRMPFLDSAVVDLAFSLPASFKIHGDGQVEKWIVRKAFTEDLPGDIAWRRKRKFSEGSGAAGLLAGAAEQEVSDTDFSEHRLLSNGFVVRNKEEMLYYSIFRDFFGDDPSVLGTVGITPAS